MKKRLEKLKERAMKAGAFENWKDAYYDLCIWPDLHKQILDDLIQAIQVHEELNIDEVNK